MNDEANLLYILSRVLKPLGKMFLTIKIFLQKIEKINSRRRCMEALKTWEMTQGMKVKSQVFWDSVVKNQKNNLARIGF
jgi:hypothetical protein